MRKPLSGAILGILIGVALAIVLQRQGIWPLDQLTLFLLPALTGLLGLLLLSIGRQGSTVTMVIALLILIPMMVWGALGLGLINEKGQLNGGCEVFAISAVDDTVVTDTYRNDPFEIDPDGGLEWGATSPTVFMDYDWEIWVVLGGVPVTLDSDTEPNDGGSQINGGDVANIDAYAAERGIDVGLLTGVYEVGGFAATCDGFGFVKLTADGLDSIALAALITALVLLIVLVVLMYVGGGAEVGGDSESAGGSTTVADGDESPEGGDGGPGLAAEIAAAAAASGYGSREDLDKLSDADYIEVIEAAKDIDEARDNDQNPD